MNFHARLKCLGSVHASIVTSKKEFQLSRPRGKDKISPDKIVPILFANIISSKLHYNFTTVEWE